MQYNIVRNGYFTGSGDYTFTTANLNTLQDGTLSGTGVTISGINTLTLDLSQRIKVDNIRLYADDLTKSSDITFWYSDSSSGSYIQSPTYVSDYYYTTLPDPSAPMFVKVTISGVTITLYEFYVDNNDYLVAYGTDGQLYDYTLDTSMVGEEGTPQAIPIYNNGDAAMPVNAYTCVEASGVASDDYIEIASLEEGPYYAITDGIGLRTNKTSIDPYKWADGSFSNTSIHGTNDNVYVTTTLTTEVDLGSIPLSNRTYSWSVGQNCWDYDPVNRVIYAIGAETTVALKLYKRYIDSGGWIYMGQINSGVTGFTYFATMCYLNGYVYVICNLAGIFGRYDVNGAQDNWESLTSVGWSPAPHYVGMCSDKNRYIYAIHQSYSDTTAYRQFRRYDTTTSGWAAMSNAYTNATRNDGQFSRRACLAYDYDRDYIYADIGGYTDGDYIQRYSVSGNSWNTTWFNVDTYTNAVSDYNNSQTHTYYNNVLVLGHALSIGRLYYYNIATGNISYISKNTEFYREAVSKAAPDYPNPYILATDIPTSLSGTYNFPLGVAIYASNMDTDRGDFRLLAADNQKNGTYTTPVFRLEDRYQSSYFTIKNTGNVSYDSNVSNGTIKVRSSDTPPLPIFEVYIPVHVYIGSGNYQVRIISWIPYTNSYTTTIISTPSTMASFGTPYGVAVDKRNGNLVVCRRYSSSRGTLIHLNRSDCSTYISYSSDSTIYNLNRFLEFDGTGNIWGYGDFNETDGRTLRRFLLVDYSNTAAYSEAQQDFIQDMATEHSGGGCWYTNKIDATLVHMNSVGTKINIINMNSPKCICKTTDDGCWVYDSDDVKVYRYDYYGNILHTFDPPYMPSYGLQGIDEMSGDSIDGFWFRYDTLLYHTDSFGHIDVGPVTLSNPSLIRGSRTGCFVRSIADNYMYWVNMFGEIQYSRSISVNTPNMFGDFYYGYDEFMQYKYNIIPASYDPVWGSSGWTEVQKEGYFLPKKKYHQVSTKLWDSATLNGIYMAPAIKTEDIGSKQSKNIYVKTNIPDGASISDYSIILRSWWGVSD